MGAPRFGSGAGSEQEIREWATQARARAEKFQAAATQTRDVSVSQSSADGMVTVTVDAQGTMRELTITDRCQELSGRQVADMVLATMRRAQSQIPDRVAEIMRDTVGDDTDSVERIVDNYRTRFPEPKPEPGAEVAQQMRFGPDEDEPAPPATARPRPRRPRDDGDDFGDQSVLRF